MSAITHRWWVHRICDVRPVGGQTEPIPSGRLPAQVSDLSSAGVSLLVPQPFEPGTLLTVERVGKKKSPSLPLVACVVNAAEHANGEWSLGCQFPEALSTKELKDLGVKKLRSRGSDKRKWVRFNCTGNLSYHLLRSSSPRQRRAAILDLSPEGVGLVVAQPAKVGAILSLQFRDRPLATLARVAHITAQPRRRWILGCQFIRGFEKKDLRN